jgi:hypothetical protein
VRPNEVPAQTSDKKAHNDTQIPLSPELGNKNWPIADFDERFWYNLVDYITVFSATYMRSAFKNGRKIPV